MPRGQYDRSKSKAQRAAEKNADAPKSPVMKARAPYGSKKLAKATGSVQSFAKEFTGGGAERYSLTELAQLRGYFASPINTIVIGKLDTLITAKLDRMLGEIEVTKKVLQAPVQGQAPAPVQAAFNPVQPSNGQA